MIPSVEPQIAVSSLPAGAGRLPPWQQALLAVVGVLVLAVSSRVSIPVGPVPVTMQTLAVSLVGAILGWRLGAACVVVWLLAGAAGLPVLAGGSGGLAKFLGASAGYLFAFPLRRRRSAGWWNGDGTGAGCSGCSR
jgi:biotin transport system substrate-specific component